MIEYEKDQRIACFLVVLLTASLITILSTIFFKSTTDFQEKKEDEVILYDSPVTELVEIEGICPSCGQPANGFNQDIVCRNKKCELYGLPIDVRDLETE